MKEIQLTQGQIAIVDDEDYEFLIKRKWYAHKRKTFYAACHIIGDHKHVHHMHRIILNAPEDMQVDHINHNTLDNRKCNLRLCTQSQNTANSKPKHNSTSRYRGVSWHKRDKVWEVYSGKKYIGRFKTENEAATAYNKEAIKNFGKFANINIIKEG